MSDLHFRWFSLACLGRIMAHRCSCSPHRECARVSAIQLSRCCSCSSPPFSVGYVQFQATKKAAYKRQHKTREAYSSRWFPNNTARLRCCPDSFESHCAEPYVNGFDDSKQNALFERWNMGFGVFAPAAGHSIRRFGRYSIVGRASPILGFLPFTNKIHTVQDF